MHMTILDIVHHQKPFVVSVVSVTAMETFSIAPAST
jgi:hypothetical protein